MKIYPLGTVSAASNQGAIGGVNYNMFEPNESCQSWPVHNILQTKYGEQSILTRKKSAPYLQMSYNYSNIFNREYRQIERVIMDIDESLNPIFVVDFSRGTSPSNVATGGATWTVDVDDTYFYSATPGFKSNRAFLWNGRAWKEGLVTSVTLNTSIVVDIQNNNYGALPLADAPQGMVYPLYECHMAAGSQSNFKPGAYWQEDITTGEPGGYMFSGNINFVSRFKL